MSLTLPNPSSVTFGIGNAAQVGNGPFTFLALWKTGNNFGSFLTAFNGVTVRRGMFLDSDHLFGSNDFSSGFGAPTITDWGWFGLSLSAAGAHYRGHLQDFSTAGAWSHGEAVGAGNQAATGVSDSLQVGTGVTGISNGSVAVVAAWDIALGDAQIEAAATSALADLMAQNPKWAVRFRQSDPNNITDLTGGGGNETARSGAIVASADPPGYSFDLGGVIASPRRAFRR